MKKRLEKFLKLMQIFFLPKKSILVLAKFPEGNDLQDGFFQRVKAIDDMLVHFHRIYLHSDHQHYRIYLLKKNLIVFDITFSKKRLAKALIGVTLSLFTLKCGRVYSHSIYGLRFRFHRLFFILGRRRVLDVHGVVPEEILMVSQNLEQSKQFNHYEQFAIKKAQGIVCVTQAMIDHITSKYPFAENNKNFFLIPIYPTTSPPKNLTYHEKGTAQAQIIYCGGLQAWQQITKMLHYVHQNKHQYVFIFLVPQPLAIEQAYFQLFQEAFPGTLTSATPEEVKEWYKIAEYGLILRQNTLVNHAACPTKLVEYMENGIIPIVDSTQIGDFLKYDYQYISYQAPSLPNAVTLQKMVQKNQDIVLLMQHQFKKDIKRLENFLDIKTKLRYN